MTRARRAGRSAWQIFRWPLVMALANLIGLVTALFGDGWYDFISWVTLGLTLVVIVAAWRGGAPKAQPDLPGGRRAQLAKGQSHCKRQRLPAKRSKNRLP